MRTGHYRPGDLTRCLISKTVQHEMRKVLVNDPRVLVHGPIQAGTLHAPILESLARFRKDIYTRTASYLNSEEQGTLESRLALDQRSFHFYATFDGELAATVRVTAHPFELSELTSELQDTAVRFDKFLELSRLLVDPSHQKSGIGKKVLYSAMLWANLREYLGFIAICREPRKKEFERFGMEAFEGRQFRIPTRENGEYRFMWGTWRRIIGGVATTYAKKRLKKRFENLIGKKEEKRWKTLRPGLKPLIA